MFWIINIIYPLYFRTMCQRINAPSCMGPVSSKEWLSIWIPVTTSWRNSSSLTTVILVMLSIPEQVYFIWSSEFGAVFRWFSSWSAVRNWRDPAWTSISSVQGGLVSTVWEQRAMLSGKNEIDIEGKSILALLVDEVGPHMTLYWNELSWGSRLFIHSMFSRLLALFFGL